MHPFRPTTPGSNLEQDFNVELLDDRVLGGELSVCFPVALDWSPGARWVSLHPHASQVPASFYQPRGKPSVAYLQLFLQPHLIISLLR